MTVSGFVTRMEYSGTTATTLPYEFKVMAAADLKVYKNGVLLILDSDYSVTGVGQADGGNVELNQAPLASDEIVIQRETVLTQGVDYTPAGPLPSDSHEDALDKLTLAMQELKERQVRTIRLDDALQAAPDPLLPTPLADAAIGWSPDGTALVNNPGSIGQAIASAAAAAASAAAAALSESNAADSESAAYDYMIQCQQMADPIPHMPARIYVAGNLSVRSALLRIPLGDPYLVLDKVIMILAEAPTGSGAAIQLLKNGSDQLLDETDNKLLVAADATSAQTTSFTASNSFAATDYIQVDLTDVGSTTPGTDLMLAIIFALAQS